MEVKGLGGNFRLCWCHYFLHKAEAIRHNVELHLRALVLLMPATAVLLTFGDTVGN